MVLLNGNQFSLKWIISRIEIGHISAFPVMRRLEIDNSTLQGIDSSLQCAVY